MRRRLRDRLGETAHAADELRLYWSMPGLDATAAGVYLTQTRRDYLYSKASFRYVPLSSVATPTSSSSTSSGGFVARKCRLVAYEANASTFVGVSSEQRH